MTWLTWRQHRAEAFTAVAILTVISATLVAVGLPMHASFNHDIVQCIDGSTVDRDVCSTNLALFDKSASFAIAILTLLNVLPFLIGVLIGAPLLAREFETGTWQLAWTQAVPRIRWIVVKIAALGAAIVALTGAFAALITWFREPLDALYGRNDLAGFDVEGLVPMAYGVFAFAVGVAAGALLRRTIPALTVAMVAYVAVRATVTTSLRPRYRPPLTLVEKIEADVRGVPIGTGNRTDWTLGEGFADATGQRLDRTDINGLSDEASDAGVNLTTYMHNHGIQRWVDYQPAGRFWDFQYIEAGIFVGLAAILLAAVIWRVNRRAV